MKPLKEERELRTYCRDIAITPFCQRKLMTGITALVRAVREDCAKVADDLSGKMNMGSIANAGAYNIACKDIATEIRGKK